MIKKKPKKKKQKNMKMNFKVEIKNMLIIEKVYVSCHCMYELCIFEKITHPDKKKGASRYGHLSM